MTKLPISLVFLVGWLAVAPLAFAGEAGISIPKIWARATPGGATVGAAYGEIQNSGSQADLLLSISTPAAGRAEIHTHAHVDGVMSMRKLESLAIPAGSSAKLGPGGDHIMLFDLKAPLKAGDRLELKFVFEKAGEIPVQVEVAPVGAMAPADAVK